MKKVLVIITTAFTPTGGLASVMLNYYRSLNFDKIGLQIDFASTNNMDEGNLLDMAGTLSRFSREKSKSQQKKIQKQNGFYPFTIIKDPEGIDIDEKLSMVKKIGTMAKKMEPRIRQVRVVYRDTHQTTYIYTSDGKDFKDNRTQVVLSLLLVGEEKEEIQTSYEAIGGFYGYEFFTDDVVEQFVPKTVKRLSGLLSAKEAPMGTKTVVLSGFSEKQAAKIVANGFPYFEEEKKKMLADITSGKKKIENTTAYLTKILQAKGIL